MALPAVRTLPDCADFSRTVSPFVSELYDLPYQLFDSISSPHALKQIYLDTNPLISAFALSLFLSPIFLIVSEINRNYSQVDRCWSILPTLYNAHYTIWAHLNGLNTERLDTLLTASVIWSARLTFNYWRKGGYSIGSEDYRWEILRKHINAPLFFIFNVLFISLAQSVLLFAITCPTYVLLLTSRLATSTNNVAWDSADLVVSSSLVSLVLITLVSDQQQWQYQTAKAEYKKTAKVPAKSDFDQEDLDRGFIISGLWSWSRHPNFAAEQTFWVTLYGWSCLRTITPYNWSVVGAIGYLCLFQASTWFTELVSARKYPQYKEYQSLVGKFLPRFSFTPVTRDEFSGVPKADGDAKAIDSGKGESTDGDAAEARKRYDLR